MAAYTWEELGALSLARQFPDVTGGDPAAVAETVRRTGPIQSQTARSPFVALGARLPGVTHATVTDAYEQHAVVRSSTIRGTVHTSTPHHHALLDAATRVGQRALWVRILALESHEPEDLWAATEEFAAHTWRSPDELVGHVRAWLAAHGEKTPEAIDLGVGRYLGFGHGGLLRRPLKGPWSGQGAPGYRTAAAVLPDRSAPDDALLELVRVHISSYGPSSRHDVAWWAGLGLRRVDDLLERLGPVWRDGPDGRAYADLAGVPPAGELTGVRLLPEFDAVLVGYDPRARHRFVDPDHNELLWRKNNGYMLAPVLLDGRVAGYWRLEGTGRAKRLALSIFRGFRRPRKAELADPAEALSTALDLDLAGVSVERV